MANLGVSAPRHRIPSAQASLPEALQPLLSQPLPEGGPAPEPVVDVLISYKRADAHSFARAVHTLLVLRGVGCLLDHGGSYCMDGLWGWVDGQGCTRRWCRAGRRPGWGAQRAGLASGAVGTAPLQEPSVA